MSDDSITLGVKPFMRTNAVQALLTSVESAPIEKVIIADDGHTEDRMHIYERDWEFELQLIDLEFDAGVGTGRDAIVSELESDYLMMTDADMKIPSDIIRLRDALRSDESLGGIAPIMFESGRPKAYAHDLREKETPFGTILIRGMWDMPEKERISDLLIARLDVIPNLALYKADCLEDYSWDPYYGNAKDHLDNMLGHWKTTDWEFAVAPEVVVEHSGLNEDPEEYIKSRENRHRKQDARQYFLDKWGYRQILHNGIWFDSESHPFQLPNKILDWAPVGIRTLSMDIYDSLDKRGFI
jgi:hypothetical protein